MEREVIERFFSRQCTAEEAQLVAAFLKEHPGELDKYLDITEWNGEEFDENLAADLPEKMWQGIRVKNRGYTIGVWVSKAAVAAVLVGVICLGYFYFPRSAVQTAAKVKTSDVVPARETHHKSVLNQSKKMMKVSLPDNSTVQLLPGALLTYDLPFTAGGRDVYLTGEAVFNVEKNAARPFTVHTSYITTTALGTSFKVSTGKKSKDNVTVKLFAGKVVIRSSNKIPGWNKDIYLLPGQQLQYDAERMVVKVGRIETIELPTKTQLIPPVKTTDPIAGDDLTFDGAALPEVIDKLAVYFSAKISFDKSQIENLNFTGFINKNDSLTHILQLIGEMNALTIIKQGDSLVITKQQKNDSLFKSNHD